LFRRNLLDAEPIKVQHGMLMRTPPASCIPLL
jgi:hypothetical protein